MPHAPGDADPGGSCDLAVVGGGIVGVATARAWQRRHPDARIVLLEREAVLGDHQSAANSGVVHAGLAYAPGSLKARLCVEGHRALIAFCAEHGVAHAACGKVVVALEPSELGRLDALEARARANGVQGLRRIGPEELADLEPHATGIAALHSPATHVVDFGGVVAALADQLRAHGATVATGVAVAGLERRGGRVRIRHDRGTLDAARAICCAGGWSDRLARTARPPADPDPRILGFRGAYLRLRPERRDLVRALIYPVADPRLPFLGVHLTRRIDGEVLLGPTALLAGALDRRRVLSGPDLRATLTWPGTWRMARRWWRTGVGELRLAASRRAFVAACARYVPELTEADVLDGPAGVRAQAVARDGTLVDDFLLGSGGGALHVRNAPSPAATSCLALAELIADRAERAFAA